LPGRETSIPHSASPGVLSANGAEERDADEFRAGGIIIESARVPGGDTLLAARPDGKTANYHTTDCYALLKGSASKNADGAWQLLRFATQPAWARMLS
jgi:hypothetical protein